MAQANKTAEIGTWCLEAWRILKLSSENPMALPGVTLTKRIFSRSYAVRVDKTAVSRVAA
jgi:hypothetical protein